MKIKTATMKFTITHTHCRYLFGVFLMLLSVHFAHAQVEESYDENRFRQMYDLLPTPNVYRTASGAPGHHYWQQRADYKIDIILDDNTQRIYGEEVITYYNQSPDPLPYLWIQLDQNNQALNSDTYTTETSSMNERMTVRDLKELEPWFDGGFKLDYVKDINGKDLAHTVVKTMMRVDLPQALLPKQSTQIKIKWWYNINDRMKLGGRSGYEYFEENETSSP